MAALAQDAVPASLLYCCLCKIQCAHRHALGAVPRLKLAHRPYTLLTIKLLSQPSGPAAAFPQAHAQALLQTAGLVATDTSLLTCRHDDHQDNSNMEVDDVVYSYNSESSPQDPRHRSLGGLHRSDGLSNPWA